MQHGPDLCVYCKHLRNTIGIPSKCDAYPEGIPVEIRTEEVDHRKPYKGDNGIQFEVKDGVNLDDLPSRR